MIKITLLSPGQFHRAKWWLLAAAAFALLVILLASKITQLALPGLNVQPKTVVLDPKCPTPEQKEVIERNLNLYGAGFAEGYDNTRYAHNLVAMARTLGYPDPKLNEINSIIRFLREALKKMC